MSSTTTSLAGGRCRALHGPGEKPTVVTYHSDIVRQRLLKAVYQPLMRRFLDDVDAVVATSPNYVATSPILKDYSAKLSVIPLGARDIARTLMPAEAVAARRRRLGERYFVFVGALRYYKGLRYLLDAAARTQLPVVIVGTGEEQAALAAEVAARGLTNVKLLGQLSDRDKAIVLRLATGFVFPRTCAQRPSAWRWSRRRLPACR